MDDFYFQFRKLFLLVENAFFIIPLKIIIWIKKKLQGKFCAKNFLLKFSKYPFETECRSNSHNSSA